MRIHVRHIVSVYGEKRPYDGNREYYDTIALTATSIADELGQPVTFDTKLNEKGDKLIDIITPSEQFAGELCSRLEHLDKYQRVEKTTIKVDLDNPFGGN